MEELVARLNALARRGRPETGPGPEGGGLRLDEACQSVVTADGAVVPLTAALLFVQGIWS